jgi:very-short-patch-repair endonuclease
MRWTIEAQATLTRQHGVVHRRQLRALGVERRAVARALVAGELVAVTEQVLRSPAFPAAWEQAAWTGVLDAGPGSALTRRSAARVHGAGTFAREEPIDVIRHERHAHVATTCRLQRTAWLPADHVTTAAGLPVVTPLRMLFEVAGDPAPHVWRNEVLLEAHVQRVRSVANRLLADRRIVVADLVRGLAELGRRGRPGIAVMRQVTAAFAGGYDATETELEDAFLALVRRYDLPVPDPQVTLGEGAPAGRVDFVYRRAGLVVEMDSGWHDGPDDRAADRRRDNELMAMGFRVLRFRWRDLADRADEVADLLARALRPAVLRVRSDHFGTASAPQTRMGANGGSSISSL